MIQTSISFGEIKVVNSGGLDVVAEFTFTCKSYDDSNESDTTIQNFQIVRLQTANRDSSSEGWVAFNDLTSDKLLEFGSSSKEERDKAKDKLSQGAAGTLVGAKDEDYEYLGVEKPSGGVNLHEEAKKKGGTLNMEDLMKLHGVG